MKMNRKSEAYVDIQGSGAVSNEQTCCAVRSAKIAQQRASALPHLSITSNKAHN